MISLYHLCWIIPVAFWTGYLACALLTANREEDDGL